MLKTLLIILSAVLVGCGNDTPPNDSDSTGDSDQHGDGGDLDSDALPSDTDTPLTPLEACNALSNITVGDATLGASSLVGADMTWEYCKVVGTLHATLNFEIRLPTVWNDKLLYAGGGGWDGAISIIPASPLTAVTNYVFVGSDGGRQGDGLDASDFLNNPQAKADFGYQGIHSVLTIAELVVLRRYGHAPVRKYFEGCSNGGREALMQATRYPDDYDGIVVRAPAYSFTKLFQAFAATARALAVGPISDAKTTSITAAVNAQCDSLDGLADTIVANPEACDFDVSTMACSGPSNDACLTAAELATANTIYSPLLASDTSVIYPGWGVGGENDAAGWPSWVTGNLIGGTGLQAVFATGLVRYWLTGDATANLVDWNPDDYQTELAETAAILDADTNLGPFFASGGKMILMHGTNDWAISYKGSIDYFNGVAATLGNSGQRDANMEFFLQPGVQHCGGGLGPDIVELVAPIVKWVEEGVRPSEQGIVTVKLNEQGVPAYGRPLCRYPAYPRYVGAGDILLPASYDCVAD